MNGKGEIRDVELNCEFLNETASKVSPFVAFEAVHVSKVSFCVSSWTNIRKAPIFIDIEHVSASLVEPLQFLNEAEGRKAIQQITRQQLVTLIQQGIMKTRGAYNLFDRILDNLTVEVSSVKVTFQPYGKFKTRRPGPWTPPAIQMSLANIRFVSVNEYGQEAPPEEVWRHNHHRHSGSLLIYKKCELQYKVAIKPTDGVPIPLVTGRDNKMELQVAIERRVRDGEVLSVQMDATIPSVEVDLPQEAVPHVAHAVAGIAYLLAKDREFQDPLVPQESPDESMANKRLSAPIVTTVDSTLSGGDGETNEKQGEDSPTSPQKPTNAEVNIEEEGTSSEDELDEKASVSGDSDKTTALQAPASPTKQDASGGRYALPESIKNEPVIVLPNGIVVHKKISMSVSVYDAIIRGTYGPSAQDPGSPDQASGRSEGTRSSTAVPPTNNNNCFELVSKGCIVEAIWPKVTKEKGGYLQASVAYFTLEEKYNQQIKKLMSGGVQFQSKGPIESPSTPLSEVGRDETFPLFEDRVVRPDPLGLRYTFPAQAFGLKTTVDFVEPPSSDSESAPKEQIQVLHEVGVDQVEFLVDAPSWCRILSFAVNERGGGFDPRWHSGNWSRELSPEMLVSPSSPLDLDACLQTTKQIFLDENEFISSDLFNLTARLTRLETRVAACIHKDVKSCDIVTRLDEVMLLVSSALPRTMLSGRIGNSVNGDDSQKKGIIEFPNDETDVAYELERAEDPSNRQRGLGTSRAISTFRAQLTLRGLSVELKPAIDFYTGHNEPFLAPSELTMIFCFEGEPPETPEQNFTKMVVFMSMLIHRYEVNLDLDLLAAAVSTLMYHGDTFRRKLEDLTAIVQRSIQEEETEISEMSEQVETGSGTVRIPKNLRGRKVLVQKQLSHSRESGGISIAIGIQIAELRSKLWRQHVSVERQSNPEVPQGGQSDSNKHILPAVNLIDSSMKDLEIGFEATLKKKTRRVVFKGCMSALEVKACDFRKVKDRIDIEQQAEVTTDRDLTSKSMSPSDYLVEMLRIEDKIEGGENSIDYAFGFRMEEMLKDSKRRWSISTDLANGGFFHLRPEVTETLAVNVFEALLMPYDTNPADYMKSNSKVFPEGTAGAFLNLVLPATDSSDFNYLILQTPNVYSDTTKTPVEHIETFLQKALEKFVPDNVDVVLFRSRVENVVVAISSEKKSGFYSFNSHYADFIATFFLDGKPPDDRILSISARRGEPWSSLVDNYESGLHHRLKARQSLSGQESDGIAASDLRYLVPPHNFSYAYTKSKARIEMNEGMEIGGIEDFDDFLTCLRDFASRFRRMVANMKRIVSAMEGSESRTKESSISDSDGGNPALVASTKTIISVRDAKDSLNKVHSFLRSYGISVGGLFEKMQNYLDLLRFEAFQKEKDRLAAVALVSNQATGWLRLGSPTRTGQRGGITSTLWPYWAVLRKGLILVYSAPGKTQVLDIISLQGATMYQLTGGGRKRDLKRAFGIVQSNGMLHLVTIGTDREFHIWIREMSRSISASSSNGEKNVVPSLPSSLSDAVEGSTSNTEASMQAVEHDKLNSSVSISEEQTSSTHPDGAANPTPGAESDSSRGTGLQETLDVTDSTSVSGSTTSRSLTDVNDEQSMISQPETTNRRLQIRNRLAGVGQATKSRFGSASQATKSRFGSAMQIAREKGRAVADRTRQNRSTTSAESSVETGPFARPTRQNESSDQNRTEPPSPATEPSARDRAQSTDNFSLAESDISDGPTSQHRKFSEDGMLADENEAKPGMRVRFGAALRSVRGTIRKPQNSSDSLAASELGSLKLRDVSLTEPLDTSSDPLEMGDFPEEILKRLEGRWFVRVKIGAKPIDLNFLSEKREADLLDLSGDKVDKIKNLAQDNTDNKTSHGQVLNIAIFQSHDSLSEKPHSHVIREISDIYALHTSISECVGRMPPPSYVREVEPRDDHGTLKRSLAKALGLTALEAVRTTAKLLAGLLEDGMLGNSATVNVTDYHGK